MLPVVLLRLGLFAVISVCLRLVTAVQAAHTAFPPGNTALGLSSCLVGMVSQIIRLLVCSHRIFAELGGVAFVNVNKAAAGNKDRLLSAGHHR